MYLLQVYYIIIVLRQIALHLFSIIKCIRIFFLHSETKVRNKQIETIKIFFPQSLSQSTAL